MADFAEAFALRDNPFSPITALAGLKNLAAQNSLEINPLLINSEPALQGLFSSEAGPFGTYLTNFKQHARRRGFRDQPPSVGVNSSLFSIFGYEGTGKTTLAQAIISWLETCKPVGSSWHIHHEWSLLKEKDAQKQIERIAKATDDISRMTGPNSYCCIVVDNLIVGALDSALTMYDVLSQNRVVWQFLISSDRELYARLSGEGRRQITPFRTRALSANDAVAFVKHRITEFRVPAPNQPPWIAAHGLYPFDEEDIRSAFAGGVLLNNLDTIALRDFSVMISQMLMNKLDALDEEFDITTLPEAEIGTHKIWLSKEYNELMAA